MNPFEPFYLAVYGTLKKGFSNHRLIQNCKFIGEYETLPIFTMYSLGPYPAVVHHGNTSITVEIYKIESEEIAKKLDRLEGYPHLYTKEIISTEVGDLIIYLFNQSTHDCKIITSGKWTKL